MQYVHICPDDLNPAAQFAKPTRARAQLNLLQLVWTQRGNDTSTHTLRVIPTTVREPQCFSVAYPSTPMIDAGFGSSDEVKSCCSDIAAFLMHLVDTAPGSWQAIGGRPRTRLRLTRHDVPIIASTGQVVLDALRGRATNMVPASLGALVQLDGGADLWQR